jgi:S-adenosylmethionine:tRNA-ribosyltransferase-isomerase (queuine synthetase)
VEKIQRTRASGGRVVAVGTTVVRARTALRDGEVQPFAGETQIFIFQDSTFAASTLVTNFHLPIDAIDARVSFAGRNLLDAYRHASSALRFFVWDAMLIRHAIRRIRCLIRVAQQSVQCVQPQLCDYNCHGVRKGVRCVRRPP